MEDVMSLNGYIHEFKQIACPETVCIKPLESGSCCSSQFNRENPDHVEQSAIVNGATANAISTHKVSLVTGSS